MNLKFFFFVSQTNEQLLEFATKFTYTHNSSIKKKGKETISICEEDKSGDFQVSFYFSSKSYFFFFISSKKKTVWEKNSNRKSDYKNCWDEKNDKFFKRVSKTKRKKVEEKSIKFVKLRKRKLTIAPELRKFENIWNLQTLYYKVCMILCAIRISHWSNDKIANDSKRRKG